MGDSAVRRSWIFSRRKREKINCGQLPTDTFPAHKAGGSAAVGAFPAVFAWFTVDDDCIGVLDDDKLWEETESGVIPTSTVASAETIAELEAEHLASSEDFQGIPYDMGFPVGFVPILRDIWLKRAG